MKFAHGSLLAVGSYLFTSHSYSFLPAVMVLEDSDMELVFEIEVSVSIGSFIMAFL